MLTPEYVLVFPVMLLTAKVNVAALVTGMELGVIAALTSARLPVFDAA